MTENVGWCAWFFVSDYTANMKMGKPNKTKKAKKQKALRTGKQCHQ